MDEQTFLSRLFDRYNLSDFAIETQTPKYKSGLVSDIDYYRLWQYIAKEYEMKSMPSVFELNKIVNSRHFFLSKECPALQHIRSIMREPKPDFKAMPEESRQRIREIYKKLGYKSRLAEFQYEENT